MLNVVHGGSVMKDRREPEANMYESHRITCGKDTSYSGEIDRSIGGPTVKPKALTAAVTVEAPANISMKS